MNDTTTIDFVVPYVNNNDQVWRDTYIDFCKRNRLHNKIIDLYSARYNGITYIYYQLKLICKNMPWINKIFLLLSNEEQINAKKLHEISDKVEIIYHDEFIPKQYLPTFNSTTIEMFLWNIKGLSDKFIYANDDMLPTSKLEPSDFFEDGKIKIKWQKQEFFYGSTMFAYQCKNNIETISKVMNLNLDLNYIIKPVHSFTPMIKVHCLECWLLLKKYIEPHIKAFRTDYQHNQYIYPLYERFKYGTLDSNIDFLYTELDEDFDLNHQIVCVNLEKDDKYVDKFLKEIRLLCE